MYKLVVLAALVAAASAAPGLIASPVVSTVPLATSHTSIVRSSVVHPVPVVHAVHATPVVHAVHAAPVVHAVPVLKTAPIVHTVHTAPVLHTVHASPIVHAAPVLVH